MTANQAIAMAFPLLTAAAVLVTVLFIRRPWAAKGRASTSDIGEVMAASHWEALDEAERLINGAQRQIERARKPASKEASTN